MEIENLLKTEKIISSSKDVLIKSFLDGMLQDIANLPTVDYKAYSYSTLGSRLQKQALEKNDYLSAIYAAVSFSRSAQFARLSDRQEKRFLYWVGDTYFMGGRSLATAYDIRENTDDLIAAGHMCLDALRLFSKHSLPLKKENIAETLTFSNILALSGENHSNKKLTLASNRILLYMLKRWPNHFIRNRIFNNLFFRYLYSPRNKKYDFRSQFESCLSTNILALYRLTGRPKLFIIAEKLFLNNISARDSLSDTYSTKIVAYNQTNLGYLYQEKAKRNDSLELLYKSQLILEQSEIINRRNSDIGPWFNSKTNLSNTLKLIGEKTGSVDVLKKALDHVLDAVNSCNDGEIDSNSELVGKQRIAIALNSAGTICRTIADTSGDFGFIDRSIQYLFLSANINKVLRNHYNLSTNYMNLANAFANKSNDMIDSFKSLNTALSFIHQAKSICPPHANDLFAHILTIESMIYLKMSESRNFEKIDDSIKIQFELLDSISSHDDDFLQLTISHNLASTLAQRSRQNKSIYDNDLAINLLLKFLSFYKLTTHPSDHALGSYSLALCYIIRNEISNSPKYLQFAAALLETVIRIHSREKETSSFLSAMTALFNVRMYLQDWESVEHLYIDYVSNLLEIIPRQEKQIHGVLLRMRFFNDALAYSRLMRGLYDQAVFAVDAGRTLLLKLGQYSKKRLDGQHSREDGSPLISDIDGQTIYQKIFPSSSDIGNITQLINQNEIIVIPILTEMGSAIILIPPGISTLNSENVIYLPETTISSVNRIYYRSNENRRQGWLNSYFTFREIIQSSEPDEFEKQKAFENVNFDIGSVLEELWEFLMRHVSKGLEVLKISYNSHVIFISPGLLLTLPIHAARSNTGDGTYRYFFEKWPLSQLPSVSSFLSIKAHQKKLSSRSLLAIIDPSTDISLPPPEFSEWFSHSSKIDLNREHTVHDVRGQLSEFSHIIFACHGFWDVQDYFGSGLALSDNEVLTFHDINDLDLTAVRLAVLVSCETGLVDIVRLPNEALGLPTAFLNAGASNVIASIWPIEAEAIQEILNYFYKELRSGANPTKSLFAAIQAYLKNGNEHSENMDTVPLLWAGIVSYGI